MTAPDELVQAAAEAIRQADPSWMGAAGRREIARIAIEAAFAKLPGCRWTSMAVAEALLLESVGDETIGSRAADRLAGLALAALAREFRGRE